MARYASQYLELHHFGQSRSPGQCVFATRCPKYPRSNVLSLQWNRDAQTDSVRSGWSLAFGSSPAGERGIEGGWRRAMRAIRSSRWTSEGRSVAMAFSERDKGIRGGWRHRECGRSLRGAGEGSRYHRRGQILIVSMNLGLRSAATSHQDDRTASSPAAASTPQACRPFRTFAGSASQG